MRAADLRVERAANPLGLGLEPPRFSWTVAAERRGTRQVAYRVVVGSTPDAVARGDGEIWDSGEVSSAENAWVTYGGPTLSSRRRLWWSVQLVDDGGERSPWAAP